MENLPVVFFFEICVVVYWICLWFYRLYRTFSPLMKCCIWYVASFYVYVPSFAWTVPSCMWNLPSEICLCLEEACLVLYESCVVLWQLCLHLDEHRHIPPSTAKLQLAIFLMPMNVEWISLTQSQTHETWCQLIEFIEYDRFIHPRYLTNATIRSTRLWSGLWHQTLQTRR